jgi:hypothetical protein
MPFLTKKFFLERPTVLSSDGFLHRIHEKYFGDGGASQGLPEADFHTVHKTLNSLLREPFLSEATAGTQKPIEGRMPGVDSFVPNVAQQREWEKCSNVSVLDKESVEADLFRLATDYVADIASVVLMGEAFHKNNPGIIKHIRRFDRGFGALLTGVPGLARGMGKAKAARTPSKCSDISGTVAKLAGEDPEPKWGGLSDASEAILVRTKALLAVNAKDSITVASRLAIFWSLLVNTNKVIF